MVKVLTTFSSKELNLTIILFSSITITLALVFYSIGVWSERLTRYLRRWHVITFWIGLTFDITGTLSMHFISDDPFNLGDTHTLTGQIALWLMLIHAIWATRVVKKDNERLRKKFHSYSIIVWIIWLVPFIGGMIMGMNK